MKTTAAVWCLCAAFLLLTPLSWAQADQPSLPEANPEDVASVDAIMTAVYDAISGPAGPRDWDRFRSLFIPGARLLPVVEPQNATPSVRVMSPDDYIQSAGAYFNTNGFFETEVYRTEERYGRIVHAFSTYESRRSLDDKEPFMRGINSFQLMHDGNRWWVVSIFWNHENPTRPIPDKYLSH